MLPWDRRLFSPPQAFKEYIPGMTAPLAHCVAVAYETLRRQQEEAAAAAAAEEEGAGEEGAAA